MMPLTPPSIAPSPTRTNWCTRGVAADEHMIGDRNVAAEQHAVGEDDVVADVAVVADMRIGHQKAAIADRGDARRGPPVPVLMMTPSRIWQLRPIVSRVAPPR